MAVGAQPFPRPRIPSSLTVTLNPLKIPLYLAGFVWILHLTKSRGTTAVCVIPQLNIPPKPHRA